MFDTYAGGGSWYDPSKVAAAQAAQGKGADGRTVLSGANLLSILNPVSGLTQAKAGALVQQGGGLGDDGVQYATPSFYQPGYYQTADGSQYQTGLVSNAYTSQAEYDAANAAAAKAAGLDPTKTYVRNTFDNPTGNGSRDQAQGIYQVNADGTATPVGASNEYSPGDWNDFYRPLVENGAAAIGVGAGIGAAAGALGAGAAGAAGSAGTAGAAAGTAGMSSADLAALYGSAGYGDAAAGAAAAGTAGVGTGVAGGAAAGAAGLDAAGTGVAGGTALGGGATSIESGLGINGFGAGLGTATSAAGVTGGVADAGALGAAGTAAVGSVGGGSSSLLGGIGDYLTSNSGLKTLGGLASTGLQAYESSNALKAQTDATNNANALSKYIYDTNRSDNAPLLATRNTALTGLNSLMSNPQSITSDPGYQFGLSQGVQGVDRSAASRGGLYSGATLKALDRYGNDYAQTKLSDSFNRLSTAAGLGAPATASNTTSGNNYGNVVGNNLTSQGTSAGQTLVNQGTLYGNLLNSAVSTYTNRNNDKPGG